MLLADPVPACLDNVKTGAQKSLFQAILCVYII